MSLQEKAVEAIRSLNKAGANSFITAESGGGEEPKVVAKFRSAEDMFAYYKSLVECGRVAREAIANQPTPEVPPQEAQQDTQQVEYITPTAEHVGQMVEVFKRGLWRNGGELLSVLPEDVDVRFIVRDAESQSDWDCWREARVAVKR